MDASRSRPWVGAALAVLALLFVVDLATAPHVAVITLYGIAPLIASLGATWRSTAGVGTLALLAAVISRLRSDDMEPANGILFIFAVAALGALATSGAFIRTRRERAAARASVLAAASEALAGSGDSTRGCAPSRPRPAARSRSGRSPRPARRCSRAGSGWGRWRSPRPTPSWPPSSPSAARRRSTARP